ncbi:MAG TPA: OpgC domain-containing protein [Blastocatellia bacterium]|nr:OpgC domain-containing protein [Blastocatellia bacterium]
MNYSTTSVREITSPPFEAAATAPVSLAGADKREVEIDVLRGWCIVMMIVMHVGTTTRLNAVVHPHQYVTAASGFVFLAGWLLGQISGRRLANDGPRAAYRRIWSRALKLWAAHCVLMFGTVILHETTGLLPMSPVSETGGWANALWMIPTLRLQSEYYLNILPVYIVFVALTPLWLEAMRRNLTALLMACSGALYLAAQYFPDLWQLAHPASGARIFSLPGWQFLYFSGLALGYHRKKLAGEFWPAHRQWLLPVCLTLSAALFILAQFQRPSHPSLHLLNDTTDSFWFNRVTHAPGRLVVFFTTIIPCYLLVRYCLRNEKFPGPLRWLATMGRASLYCFIVHLIFAIAFRAINTWSWPLWSQEVLTAGTVVLTWLMARHQVLARVIPN